ncbi:MAG TPA: hypothetical protein VMR23_09345 [Candidatus Limnocylindria bacterium]|nr:hypothetical protein [Candidatus Limnocylindria bacterium]
MMRLAAAMLVMALAALPLTVLSAPPVAWLAACALVIGGAGVIALSVPLVTAGASLALIAYTLALVVARAAVDPVAGIAAGATLVLLLALVHFAARVRGAAVAGPVIAAQIRQWLAVAAAGVVAALVLSAAASAAGAVLRGAGLAVVVVAAALGALLAAAGMIALMTTRPPR